MIATVKKSNNARLPAGTSVPVVTVFSKFESVTFGRFFVVRVDGQDVRCREWRCDTLHGGEWELDEKKGETR